MIDRENVIKRLKRISEWLFQQYRVVYDGDAPNYYDAYKTVDDAIALLKEKEAKPMTEYDDGWDCPRCGLKLVGKTASGYPFDVFDLPIDEIVKYCPVCGQAVIWK